MLSLTFLRLLEKSSFTKCYYWKHLTNTHLQMWNYPCLLKYKKPNVKSPPGLTEQLSTHQTVEWFMQILAVF